ncbi:MAG: hypothetical protein C0407_17830, partial [Desulfobacca sp.]|nr:hypothetical protein [Desulfobacca sp.]
MIVSVPLESIQPGMVLADPIFNRFGQVLLNKGVQISDRHLNVLKTWGILKALIEGGQSDGEQFEINEEMRTRALARLNKRLLWHPNTPLEE